MFKNYIKSHAWGLLAVMGAFVTSWAGWNIGHDGLLLVGLGTVSMGDVNDMLEKQGKSFEDFVKRNDQRIKSVEKDLIDIMKKANRRNVGGSDSPASLYESKHEVATYIRSRGEIKAMSSGSGPDGGWTVHPVFDKGIGGIVRNTSVLRELVGFVEIEAGDAYEELLSTTPVGTSWVGETQSRPGTDSPQLKKITTPLREQYAMPVLSQRLADDSGTAMVDFLVNECALSFAEAEEFVLFNGDGVNQPRGLNTIDTSATADDARAFGVIEHIVTGADGGFAAAAPLDAIKKVFYRLRAGYRKNAKWVCNSETALELSNLKDGEGNYLWDEGKVKDGAPPTLLGRPVVICETAPAIGSGANALWFGDFEQGLRAIERPGNKLLLDPFTDKPNLRVYVYRRVGLQLRNSNAIKCLKFST